MDEEVRVRITADDEGASETFENVGQTVSNTGQEIDQTGQETQETEEKVSGLKSAFGDLGEGLGSLAKMFGIVSAAAAAWKINAMIQDCVRLDMVQQQNERSLKQFMVTTGRFSESYYASMKKLASGMQELTSVGDEEILQGMARLQIYDKISTDLMPRVTKAMLDLAVVTRSTETAAMLLGKASEGMTDMMSRYGIVIDKVVYEQKGFLGILEQIEAKMGGQAETLAEGSGKWKVLAAGIGDTKEAFGKLFTTLAENTGVMDATLQWFKDLQFTIEQWIPSTIPKIDTLNDALIAAYKKFKELEYERSRFFGLTVSEGEVIVAEAKIKLILREIDDELKKMAEGPSFIDTLLEQTKDLNKSLESSEEAISRLNEFMFDLTATPKEKELQKVRDFFNSLPDPIRSSAIAMGYLAQALDEVAEKYKKIPSLPALPANLQPSLLPPMLAMPGPSMGTPLFSLPSPTVTPPDFETEKKTWAKIKQQQEEIERQWEWTAKSIGSSFTNTVVDAIYGDKDAWKRLGEYVGRVFVGGWIDQLITQQLVMPSIEYMRGAFAQGGGIGAAAGGGMTSGSWLPFLWSMPGQIGRTNTATGQVNYPYAGWDLPMMAGAGILGYQAGGWSGGMGSMFGASLAGPMGALVGGYIGAMADKASHADIEIPSFDLLWEVVDGKVKSVAETWHDMTKDQTVFNAAQQFVDDTIGFFEKLSVVAGGVEMPDWKFELGGLGENIKEILEQGITQEIIKVALGAYGEFSSVFGPGFQEQFQKMWMDTITQNLGMGVFGPEQDVFQQYMAWKFQQFTSMPGEEAMGAFTEWMNQQSLFSPVGRPGIMANSIYSLFAKLYPGVDLNNPANFPQLETFAQTVTPGWFTRGEIALGGTGTGAKEAQESWGNFFDNINTQVTDIFNMVTIGMGQAFAASLETGEYQTFEQNFKKSLMNTVEEGLIKSFAEQNLIPVIMKPLWGSEGHPAITEILNQYSEGTIGLAEAQGDLSVIFGDLNQTLKDFEPVWDVLNTAFQSMAQALGLNTTAVQGNTDAILGPVNSFLMSLDTGPLAPVQSVAGITGLGQELYTKAFANPAEFSAWSQFMGGSYLPYFQTTSQNYADIVAGIRGQVEAIPWVAQARGNPATAADIGTAVAASIAPMLLDLKEAAQITIQVVVDGQIIRQQVINSLDDPAVVQKARSKII